MKNQIYTLGIILLSSIATFGQAPPWTWANSAGGTYQDEGHSIATDASGNVVVTGYFSSPSITFGTIVLTNTNGSSADMFVVKYDGAGNVLWANSAGGTGWEESYGVTTDAGGNVLVTGRFFSPSITFGTIVLTNTSGSDMFIVKYDGAGNVLWANSAIGADDDEGRGVATDASGNVLVTGFFYSPSITFGTTVLTNVNASYSDMFIVKYDGAGNVLWANSAGGTGWDEVYGVATDAGGNILVTGYFSSPSITFGTTVLTNANGSTSDIFVVKYDGAGNVLWANSASGTDDDEGYGVATDSGGNVLITGFFYSPSITFGTTVLTNANAGYSDMFIVKYDGAGNVLWANSAGGTGWDESYGVSTDAGGNVLVTGYFSSPSITFGTTVLTNAVGSEIFIVKYDGAGNVLWANSASGTSDDVGQSVSTDTGGNVLVTGIFDGPSITFGTTVLINTNTGSNDMFIAKLDNITGIAEENYSVETINVFPDPSGNGQFNVSSSKTMDEIKITNALGQIIYEDQSKAKNISIQLDETGVYFIQTISGNQTVTKKIIVNMQ
jgi:hypothetical protein